MVNIDIIFNLIVIMAGFFILAKASELILISLSDYAKRLGLSEYVIGFTAISIASIIPELISALTGTVINNSEIILGTVFGSNIFKLPLLGIALLFARDVKNDVNAIGNAPILTLFLTVLPFILAFDNSISREDGFVLLLGYIIYLYSFLRTYSLGILKKRIKFENIYKDAVIFFGSLTALLLSAQFLIFNTIKVSEVLELPFYIMAMLIIGSATSMPEIMLQFRLAIKNKERVAIGHILGAIVANSTLVLGVTALLHPILVPAGLIFNTGIFLIIGTIISIYYQNKERLNWKHGIMFILFYVVFLISEIFF